MSEPIVGHRLHAVTVPDDKNEPRVVYLVPVDKHGRKAGPTRIGTLSKTRADALELGAVLKAPPTNLGDYTPPPKRGRDAGDPEDPA